MNQPQSLYEKILQAEKQSTIQEITDRENSKRIRVHMPCKVVDIHDSTVDVEIQGMEDTGFGYYSKFPVLLDLPIIYNNYTNSAYIITPVQKGDTGLVEFLDFNSSMFNQDGNTGITLDNYYHSLNNGVFINGFIPNNKIFNIQAPNNNFTQKNNNPTMLEEPNDELWDRPKVQNEDGTFSTAVTITIGIEYQGQEALVIIPTVYDGEHHTEEEAIERFNKTGLHFGIFSADNPEVVEQYSENLHNEQEKYIQNNNTPITIGLHNKTFSFNVMDNGNLQVNSLNTINFSSSIGITLDTPQVTCTGSLGCDTGASGVFQAGDKSVTVLNGIIVSIE